MGLRHVGAFNYSSKVEAKVYRQRLPGQGSAVPPPPPGFHTLDSFSVVGFNALTWEMACAQMVQILTSLLLPPSKGNFLKEQMVKMPRIMQCHSHRKLISWICLF